MTEEPDYYRVLQVTPDAEQEVIKAAYERLAKKYHPDKNENPSAAERMTQLNVAYDVIGDLVNRREYDARRHARSGRVASDMKQPSGVKTTDPSSSTTKANKPSTGRSLQPTFNRNVYAWLLVLAISAFWLAAALSTKQYFMALSSIFFLAMAMLVELPDSSSEEGSSDDES